MTRETICMMRRVFESEDGRKALEQIRRICGNDRMECCKDANTQYFLDGKRSVYVEINNILNTKEPE